MIGTCHKIEYIFAEDCKKKHLFNAHHESNDTRINTQITPDGRKWRKSEILKLRNLILVEINSLIGELKKVSEGTFQGEDVYLSEWWNKIILNYQNIMININSLFYYCEYPSASRVKILKILDKLGDFLCCAGLFIENYNWNENIMNEKFDLLLFNNIVPLLKNTAVILEKEQRLELCQDQ